MPMWTRNIQWTTPVPPNCRRWFRVYRWRHPTRGNDCRFIGVILLKWELRWWHIKEPGS